MEVLSVLMSGSLILVHSLDSFLSCWLFLYKCDMISSCSIFLYILFCYISKINEWMNESLVTSVNVNNWSVIYTFWQGKITFLQWGDTVYISYSRACLMFRSSWSANSTQFYWVILFCYGMVGFYGGLFFIFWFWVFCYCIYFCILSKKLKLGV